MKAVARTPSLLPKEASQQIPRSQFNSPPAWKDRHHFLHIRGRRAGDAFGSEPREPGRPLLSRDVRSWRVIRGARTLAPPYQLRLPHPHLQ